MKTNINVESIFTSIISSTFTQLTTIEELKEAANAICAQVKNAYEVRVAELQPTAKATKKVATKPTAKAVAEKAKEAAAKFKKQEKSSPKAKEEAAPAKAKATSDDTLIAVTDTAAIKKLGLTFEKYSEKCWVLRGNTKPLRKVLKEQFKGVYNSHLTGGEGWVIRTEQVKDCAKALCIKLKAA